MPKLKKSLDQEEFLDLAAAIVQELRGKLFDPEGFPRANYAHHALQPSKRSLEVQRLALWCRLGQTTFKFNGRLKRALGRAFHDSNLIEFALPMADPRNREVGEDVIRHELAHLLAPQFARHGGTWKVWARWCGAVPARIQQKPLAGGRPWSCKHCGKTGSLSPRFVGKVFRGWSEERLNTIPPEGVPIPGWRCSSCSHPALRVYR